MFKFKLNILVAGLALLVGTWTAHAGPLADRATAGQPIRIGFANVLPFGYPDDQGHPKGFANEIALGVLKKMGYTNVETTVTDWGGLIPGLQASRYDIITGGMYILGARCKNVSFSEPIAKLGDGFIVTAGNPKNINTYKDIAEKGAVFVTYAGSSTIAAAKKEGIAEDKIMVVPGPSEVLAAIKAGRGDAGSMTYLEAKLMADQSNGAIQATDPAALPEWTYNWVGLGFRSEDADFLAKFNEALKQYVGSEEMMTAVKQYGIVAASLPGDTTTKWICENR
ncbi:ectoine/hydroxyectoine ABC transporter substrate-binding protein EhuB (plasmid) [Mesorhizobium sp. 131-2-5]|uniref:transporter substrate-binding domain-containing protein n=1 Tax=Mesorhizobium sp. 131-2-5 TaxID=2744519 RepID=UPI0018EB2C6C|nr:transporter substrate-binding domain-containing protein [Mesorhizobium sp. 131-2-5]BCH05279.1 ectoine/hydroxyectoine ABC transporter substrate-binding protein EhuB [Mesorhizobium sp. 131-2-5]